MNLLHKAASWMRANLWLAIILSIILWAVLHNWLPGSKPMRWLKAVILDVLAVIMLLALVGILLAGEFFVPAAIIFGAMTAVVVYEAATTSYYVAKGNPPADFSATAGAGN